tara:strand:- start:4152 stop:4733 length:582 start_codon:yes stop_codon:yes gene_type:complete
MFILFIILSLISFLSINEFNLMFQNIFKNKPFPHFFSILFSLIIVVIFSLTVWINLMSNNINDIFSIIFLLLICSSTDIGGFVFGKIIGGKRLTKISPNKTYSGVLGSFLFALLFGFSFFNFLNEYLFFKINIFIIIIIISAISQLGDLIISFLKRKAKFKDTGNILPGHGGILDRIDGIVFAVPLGLSIISI